MYGSRLIFKKRYERPNDEKLWAQPESPRQSLTILRDDTWDAPLKPQRFVNISDKDYVRILDPSHTTSRCAHNFSKICCPCGAPMGLQKCTDCQTLVCSEECPTHRSRSDALVAEKSNITDGSGGKDRCLELDLTKFATSWIPAEGGMYAPKKTLEDKDTLKRYMDFVRTSYSKRAGPKS